MKDMQNAGSQGEGPKVHVERSGVFSVRAEDILRSEKGRAQIREAARVLNKMRQQRLDKSSAGAQKAHTLR